MTIGVWAHARLVVDIWSIKALILVLGRKKELLNYHAFFFDRYSELADYHRASGRLAKADRFGAIAATHYRAVPPDDDPREAAAMAMPVPRPRVNPTNAVSDVRLPRPPPTLARRDHCAPVVTNGR